MTALARAFRWAAGQPRGWSREHWRRFVGSVVRRFEEGPEGFTEYRRRPYGWGMICAQATLRELAQEVESYKDTKQLLARTRRERAAVRQEAEARAGARAEWKRLAAAGVSVVSKPQEAKCLDRECPNKGCMDRGCRVATGEASGAASPVQSSHAEKVGSLVPFRWSASGYWVLGAGAVEDDRSRLWGLEERIKRLELEARCGDPEREALARAVLQKLTQQRGAARWNARSPSPRTGTRSRPV